MTTLQLTKDVASIIAKVTGTNPNHMYNDARKTFRRYKVLGVGKVTNTQAQRIGQALNALHPKAQFVVANHTPKSLYGMHARSVTIKVFSAKIDTVYSGQSA